MARTKRFALSLIVLLLAGSAAAPPAAAQYFGRNKVQYEDFDFEILRTDHFDIYYYPEERVAIEYAAIMAERWYARLSRVLNHDLSGRQPLILYASAPHFRQTNTLQGNIGEGTGGVTEILKRRIVLPFAGPLPETDHVLGHELVHAFQFDITGEGGGVALAGVPEVLRFPLWFVEGMAEYLSIGPSDPNTAMWMRDAIREELPDFRKLSDPRFFPYRYGHSLWSYIAGRWGDDVVGRVLKAARTARSPAAAFARVLRSPPDSVVMQWHRALQATYAPLQEQTDRPEEYARPLITPQGSGGNLNIAPALSPDGTQVVFLSERDLFSIDVFLADVETGEVIRKITETAVDPHFESLQFINSAGAWDFEGRHFVFGAITGGRPVLTIIEMASGDVVREVRLPEIGEIYSPAWSPDGRYIAFSGLVGGLSDLYVYDLERSTLNRLTNDAYADLQPAWSPDGNTIAFVSDRFSTGLTSLLYGNYRIALLDWPSGGIREGPGFQQGKHITPQWAPDGSSLYFVSDQNGISNVYRAELARDELFQVTNLYTGVSGITALSPALSVAARTGVLAMSVYQEDATSIYVAEQRHVLAGGPVRPPLAGVDPAVLPPADRLTRDVPNILANAFFGLPDSTQFETADYGAKFALDYIGQPSLAIGADRFGTFIAGGVSLFFSDMLGNHNLVTGLQVQGTLKDLSGLVGYTNLTRRLNWGAALQQITYRGLFGGVFLTNSGYIESLQIFRQTNRSASLVAAYPFNRAQRLELSGGFLNISYDIEQRVQNLSTGQVLLDTVLPAPSPVSLGQASAALVYDNSLFGVASPLLGQRYRLEVGTNVGTIDFHTGLADFRKYVMPVRPFTLAARIMHFGRYGPDGENFQRLRPTFIGYDGLVRGYGAGSFDFVEECEPDGTSCPNYTNLWGSKLLIGNLELRFPPLGLLGIGSGLFGSLPLEAILFGDAGLAWFGQDPQVRFEDDQDQLSLALNYSTDRLNGRLYDDRAFFLGGDRTPVYSAGGGLRMNVFGFAIIELVYVHPFSRNRGGHLQFSFTPGF
jgi:hypothetical protein